MSILTARAFKGASHLRVDLGRGQSGLAGLGRRAEASIATAPTQARTPDPLQPSMICGVSYHDTMRAHLTQAQALWAFMKRHSEAESER